MRRISCRSAAKNWIIDLPGTRLVAYEFTGAAPSMSMIETINLTKKYGELVALNNLNLAVDQGDCFGFIGPNGAGKTTTIKILATLLKPTWGEARIDGKVIGY